MTTTNWTLDKLRDEDKLRKFSISFSDDCYLLDTFNPSPQNTRGYSIYKVFNNTKSVYIMLLTGLSEHRNPLVLISESKALEFLNDREKASRFAFFTWLKRYH